MRVNPEGTQSFFLKIKLNVEIYASFLFPFENYRKIKHFLSVSFLFPPHAYFPCYWSVVTSLSGRRSNTSCIHHFIQSIIDQELLCVAFVSMRFFFFFSHLVMFVPCNIAALSSWWVSCFRLFLLIETVKLKPINIPVYLACENIYMLLKQTWVNIFKKTVNYCWKLSDKHSHLQTSRICHSILKCKMLPMCLMCYFDNENQRGLGCKFYFDEKSYDCVYICLNVRQ